MQKSVVIHGTEWNIAKVRESITNNKSARLKALLKVYEGQTSDEQRNAETKYINGEGFNYFDSSVLTDLAELVIKGKELTEKQDQFLIKKMPKYSQQIFRALEQLQEKLNLTA